MLKADEAAFQVDLEARRFSICLEKLSLIWLIEVATSRGKARKKNGKSYSAKAFCAD